MVYRIFVEKKRSYALEAQAMLSEIRDVLGVQSLTDLRILNRYDAENIDEELFRSAVGTVFSEPQVDTASESPALGDAEVFAVEYLPGQFDQRASSAEECIAMISCGERPLIRSAKVYALYGALSGDEIERIKRYVINPVEAREASLDRPSTLQTDFAIPTMVPTLTGFCSLERDGLSSLCEEMGLAMDLDDLLFCQEYFRSEHRDPTVTEIRMIDTYWSDHCRHTTFLTHIDSVRFEDEALSAAYDDYLKTRDMVGDTKPICLMDLATVAVKYLKQTGKLSRLDESEEINACTVKIDVNVDGNSEPWLLLFKNETHNHPTEIEPFGGAATCIGGAIRDPLSGRAYVYGAMRVTGAADPTVPLSETLEGKLPQRKIVTTAAAGYSSYGNQIGLATGIVDELYHPGYAAKRMEIGAVIAAAPASNVRRETPAPGDVVILLGGATGRDGIGGATGSSKVHTLRSVETCSAEVQKGNAPEERKLQRLFRNPVACRMIKRCNDFGAGGVSVAIGELADGLDIDLNAVPKKYEGLDGTELAISESQERMAVVVAPKDAERFITLADQENLSAIAVARVQEEKRLVMHWNGRKIVDVNRDFLNSNGADKHIDVVCAPSKKYEKKVGSDFAAELRAMASDLNICSKRGLSERFDSTIGAGAVLMPFGGRHQLTPVQAMVQKVSVERGHTDTCSLMAWGYNPAVSERSPYHGAYLAVVESVSKLIAAGASFEDVYLTFQEYFPKPGADPVRWGQPMAALLGAFKAQMALGIASIGGKDSMSGTFEKLDVPPTLVSFAVTTATLSDIVSPEFKRAGHMVYHLSPDVDENGLPDISSLMRVFATVTELLRSGRAVSAYTPGVGGIAEAVMKACFGNGFGFSFDTALSVQELFSYCYGSFVLECVKPIEGLTLIGTIVEEPTFRYGTDAVSAHELLKLYEGRLESVYPCAVDTPRCSVETISYPRRSALSPALKTARPRVLIPVFPGTNCEYDSMKAMEDAGAAPKILVLNNLSPDGIARSIEQFSVRLRDAQMIFIPGGFSGGDEPDGSGKLITAFFRSASVREGVGELLERRDGLICGICNGFQALIKLGLVPYGKIIDADASAPTLTYNTIARHQSKIVRTRIASVKSPWLSAMQVGDIVNVPISHGEGRFIAPDELLQQLIENGQIATQYVDLDGNATMDIRYNPNGSMLAVEGITSPDGRVFGKMGHSERVSEGLYRNIPGSFDIKMFRSAVSYFR